MENNTLTLDELNKLPKNAIALLYMQMSESFALLSEQNKTIQKQNELLIKQTEDLKEQLAILTPVSYTHLLVVFGKEAFALSEKLFKSVSSYKEKI